MTDNEIIRALECFLEKKPNNECNGCSYHETYYKEFTCCSSPTEEELIRNALDLINRQKAEIERLKEEKDNLIRTYAECQAEAVKEFAKRLKEMKYKSSDWSHGEHPYVVEEDDIDNLEKEFTEGG